MRHVTLLQLSHFTMHVATSNTNYILLFCFCHAHCKQMCSVAKLFKGILALQLMPARDAPAAIIPATVRLLWLQLLLPLQVCHLVPPTRPPFGPVRPTSAGATLAASRATKQQTITPATQDHHFVDCHTFVLGGGGGGGGNTTSVVRYSAVGVAWRRA